MDIANQNTTVFGQGQVPPTFAHRPWPKQVHTQEDLELWWTAMFLTGFGGLTHAFTFDEIKYSYHMYLRVCCSLPQIDEVYAKESNGDESDGDTTDPDMPELVDGTARDDELFLLVREMSKYISEAACSKSKL